MSLCEKKHASLADSQFFPESRATPKLDDGMPSSRSGRLQALYLAWPESFVDQLLEGLVPAEHPGVYHLPMVKEHRLGDIIANSVTHGIGAAFALAGAVILVVTTVGGTAWQIASCLVFGCTLVLVYVCSTLYHSLVRTRARHVLQIIDHSAIYLLIAGTYTPFALVSLRGQLGWLLFAIVWGLAILGILFKSFAIGRFAIASVVVYLGMGWLGVFVMRPLLHALTWHGIVWIVLGGLLYTAGIVFFAFDRLSYFHALWHLFVLAGSTCHYFAVLFYVAQPRT
jgi:hemolysin III